jgi:hypothetical protein
VIPPLMTYLKTHNPDCIARCAMAREDMAYRRRMQSVDVPGLGEMSLDLSAVKTTLIDIYFGAFLSPAHLPCVNLFQHPCRWNATLSLRLGAHRG